MGNCPIFVTYDDAANDVPDVQGNVTDFIAFCAAIERGRIKNVRLWEPEELKGED